MHLLGRSLVRYYSYRRCSCSFKDDWGDSGGSGGSLGSLISKKLLKVENVFNVAETDMIN